MEYSIGEVAALAGVSRRTLRHYDDLGLLVPAYVAGNGYRRYGRRELLRLQRILLFRRLRVPLEQVEQMLDGENDQQAALESHRQELLAERDRLDRIIATVERTAGSLTGERPIDDADFFDGLAEGKARLREDLVARYGQAAQEHFATADQATAHWDRSDYDRAAEQGRDLLGRMSLARSRGVPPEDAEALDLVAEHYQQVRALWQADAAAYRSLADLIIKNPEQHRLVAEADPDLPTWLSAGIKAYVSYRLP